MPVLNSFLQDVQQIKAIRNDISVLQNDKTKINSSIWNESIDKTIRVKQWEIALILDPYWLSTHEFISIITTVKTLTNEVISLQKDNQIVWIEKITQDIFKNEIEKREEKINENLQSLKITIPTGESKLALLKALSGVDTEFISTNDSKRILSGTEEELLRESAIRTFNQELIKKKKESPSSYASQLILTGAFDTKQHQTSLNREYILDGKLSTSDGQESVTAWKFQRYKNYAIIWTSYDRKWIWKIDGDTIEIVVDNVFKDIEHIGQWYYKVSLGREYWIIDCEWKVIVPFVYDELEWESLDNLTVRVDTQYSNYRKFLERGINKNHRSRKCKIANLESETPWHILSLWKKDTLALERAEPKIELTKQLLSWSITKDTKLDSIHFVPALYKKISSLWFKTIGDLIKNKPKINSLTQGYKRTIEKIIQDWSLDE